MLTWLGIGRPEVVHGEHQRGSWTTFLEKKKSQRQGKTMEEKSKPTKTIEEAPWKE